jgi:hypothetical protein
MNIKELNEKDIKSLLYDIFMEKRLIKNNIKILQDELIRREESAKEKDKNSIEIKQEPKNAT